VRPTFSKLVIFWVKTLFDLCSTNDFKAYLISASILFRNSNPFRFPGILFENQFFAFATSAHLLFRQVMSVYTETPCELFLRKRGDSKLFMSQLKIFIYFNLTPGSICCLTSVFLSKIPKNWLISKSGNSNKG